MADRVQQWLRENDFGEVVHRESVGGGCISEASRLHLDQGSPLFLKQNSQAPDTMFITEAAGLTALAEANALRVPEVIHVENDFILLEDLGQGSNSQGYWQELGEGLAMIHSRQRSQFGFALDNYCGSTPQQNTLTDNGYEFFAAYRILNPASAALQKNLLDRADLDKLETIAANLKKWIPEQAAVLIHGDLWSGNVHCGENGKPALIDPAVYWGWAEAELAMTLLFGGFDEKFYSSYEAASGVDKDWRERVPLYNLYHLLNHLLLFGGSYLSSIRQISKRFA